MSSRPVPQTSVGKLVSLSVDNPKYYTSQQQPPSVSPPPLFPNSDLHNEEQTMLWRNIATLFAKCDQNEEELQKHQESYERLTRGTDELYQELQETKNEIQRETNENNLLSTHVRKLRKYVNKKCENVRETIAYGSYNSDNEIFAYIDKMRSEFQAKTAKMEDEITILQEKLIETTHIYDSDYTMFVQRENDLMAKLDQSVQMTETLSQRVRELECNLTAEIHHCVGDLREEFTHAICREMEFESNANEKRVQSVNEELFDLITRSNEYHTARHFGMVEDVKAAREMCETLKQSISMVDAELSDTKETVEYLKDEVAQTTDDITDLTENWNESNDEIYREMDRDYYDLKDYVKRRLNSHNKHNHAVPEYNNTESARHTNEDPIQMIVREYAEAPAATTATTATATTAATTAATATTNDTFEDEETILIMDGIISDDNE
jgi:chromosome segregation ATPase